MYDERLTSRIVRVGIKKMALCIQDPKLFLIVISAKINDDLMAQDIFTMHESVKILEYTLQLACSLKVPDMQYIILNTFEMFKNNQFFVNQALLKGQSLCDICIGDQKAVQ